MTRRAAYYKKTQTGQPNELRIDQRTLSFVAGLVAIVGVLVSMGISYGVMRFQLDGKADRLEVQLLVRDSLRAVDARVSRNTTTLQSLTNDMDDLKSEVGDIKRRTTDIACELVRPRRTYCR